jgi:hypothetical protein
MADVFFVVAVAVYIVSSVVSGAVVHRGRVFFATLYAYHILLVFME